MGILYHRLNGFRHLCHWYNYSERPFTQVLPQSAADPISYTMVFVQRCGLCSLAGGCYDCLGRILSALVLHT